MRLRRRRKEISCRCGHPDWFHMGLYGKCLAALDNGSDAERRLSDLCCDVAGGCKAFVTSGGTTDTRDRTTGAPAGAQGRETHARSEVAPTDGDAGQ